MWRRNIRVRPVDQESCRTSDVPLFRDFPGSASTFRTFITTTVFFIIADRLSVAAVPCEIAGAMPVGDGTCFVVFRLLCVLGFMEPPPFKLALITYGVADKARLNLNPLTDYLSFADIYVRAP